MDNLNGQDGHAIEATNGPTNGATNGATNGDNGFNETNGGKYRTTTSSVFLSGSLRMLLEAYDIHR